MPDQTPPDAQHPLTPGKHTSEHRMTLIVVLGGFGVEMLLMLLHNLQGAGVGGEWMGKTLAICTTVSQTLALLGYTTARAVLKIKALAQIDDA
jgi:hypothetical protein